MLDIAVLIPVHPNRIANGMLERALKSVISQTVQPREIHVVNDINGYGSGITRNIGLEMVRSEWVAFLDSDDEWLPHHLETLASAVVTREISGEQPVDVVYAGCRILDANEQEVELIEEWGRFGKPFDADILRDRSYIPVTSLVNMKYAFGAQFIPPTGSIYDDWGFYLQLLNKGAKFLHIPEITWIWHHHGQNTSGQATKGDAV
jgi:glycosyltransferase involved in cell wall biosynthesis